jgi:hypothetical protein
MDDQPNMVMEISCADGLVASERSLIERPDVGMHQPL